MKGLLIESVATGSIVEEMGVEAGDRLLAVNGHSLRDLIDYSYYTAAGQELLPETAVNHILCIIPLPLYGYAIVVVHRVAASHDHVAPAVEQHLGSDLGIIGPDHIMGHEPGGRSMTEFNRGDHTGRFAGRLL